MQIYEQVNVRALDEALVILGGDELKKSVEHAYKRLDGLMNEVAAEGFRVGDTAAREGEFERMTEATDEAHARGYSEGYATREMQELSSIEGSVCPTVEEEQDVIAAAIGAMNDGNDLSQKAITKELWGKPTTSSPGPWFPVKDCDCDLCEKARSRP